MDYKVNFCDEANEIISELTKEKVKLIKEKQELLNLLKETAQVLESIRDCLEPGDCNLEGGLEWLYDTQIMIKNKLEKYEEDNDE